MTMIRYEAEPGIEPRLIATFPLNGRADMPCERIFLLEVGDLQADIPCPFMREGVHGDQWVHDTYESALRVALSNSGWGQFSIKDVTNA